MGVPEQGEVGGIGDVVCSQSRPSASRALTRCFFLFYYHPKVCDRVNMSLALEVALRGWLDLVRLEVRPEEPRRGWGTPWPVAVTKNKGS